MDGGSEVCLEQKVERLYESGMSSGEIASVMGVDPDWVEALITLWSGEDESDRG